MSEQQQETKTRTYDLSVRAIEVLGRKAKEDRRSVSNYLTVLLESLEKTKAENV